MVTVSVVIPTLDRPTKLKTALRNLYQQTYKDFEVIIVDSGDRTQTETVLEEVRSLYHDSQIKYIQQPPSGPASARNLGVKQAEGKYIAFFDDDDRWHPSKLQRQVEMFQSVSSNCGIIYCGVHIQNANGTRIYTKLPSAQGDILNSLLIRNVIGTTSLVMVRQDVFDSVCGFDTELRICEDWDLYIRIAKEHQIVAVDNVLATKTIEPDGLLQDTNSHFEYRKQVIQKHRSDLLERGLLGDAQLALYKDMAKQHCLKGEMVKARQRCLQSLNKQFTIDTVLLYLFTILPASWFQTVGRLVSIPTYISDQFRG